MFLFKEIPDAASDGAREGVGGLLDSHGLRRGLKDGAPTGATGQRPGDDLT